MEIDNGFLWEEKPNHTDYNIKCMESIVARTCAKFRQ